MRTFFAVIFIIIALISFLLYMAEHKVAMRIVAAVVMIVCLLISAYFSGVLI